MKARDAELAQAQKTIESPRDDLGSRHAVQPCALTQAGEERVGQSDGGPPIGGCCRTGWSLNGLCLTQVCLESRQGDVLGIEGHVRIPKPSRNCRPSIGRRPLRFRLRLSTVWEPLLLFWACHTDPVVLRIGSLSCCRPRHGAPHRSFLGIRGTPKGCATLPGVLAHTYFDGI